MVSIQLWYLQQHCNILINVIFTISMCIIMATDYQTKLKFYNRLWSYNLKIWLAKILHVCILHLVRLCLKCEKGNRLIVKTKVIHWNSEVKWFKNDVYIINLKYSCSNCSIPFKMEYKILKFNVYLVLIFGVILVASWLQLWFNLHTGLTML